ncbi:MULTISPECIES: 5'/3'-nucleotidase SurE [Micromonospora]|uniref:5'/3'-nucleotidase SurE n=1 Tax=Micromonospora TaxID=1873 RepID=UPI00112EB712|nr:MULTISPECIES: 5'/3'-nucleotidase SurE [Micromonospora]MBQ1068030.1 5'/3'-nucleotidase SurE [Micromonospora sp. D75]MCK1804521.1 5'/3'-nucleotidase SurE [Micromonospora sp. R42106]MCK1830903.1 5'/3'-nucleotidase SurE [Micromonospora sp. R42003]MCK1843078.1 5'/3'-nucleotidase SurE [Micromonospora sp. R42004]MCM1015196.1 5'/3'-nucleotidase SurE [Micromonospora sp. XM-20-01]
MTADRPPRVLVTNDDGVHAPGIRALARAAYERGLDVVVAAPQHEASGMSAALSAVTEDGRLVFGETELDGLPDVPAYAVAASPAYIAVLAGLGVFGPVPDLLLSGINRGANAGHAVLHSGTVGAALTAGNNGIRALAVSLDVLTPAAASAGSGGAAIAVLDSVDDESRHWATAAELAATLLPWLAEADPGTVLNLNVPDLPADQVAGLRQATLAPFGQVQVSVAERGEGFVRTAVEENAVRAVPGTDIAWLADGYAAVTAIRALGHLPDVELPVDR